MIQWLAILVLSCLGWTTFSFSPNLRLYQQSRISITSSSISIKKNIGIFNPFRHGQQSYLELAASDQLADVGDIVLAEVEDIGGSVGEPMISLKIIGRDGPFMASMQAKGLSANEKLALQTGEYFLIYICNFHVLSHLLLIYICKLHWNLNTMFVCQVNTF